MGNTKIDNKSVFIKIVAKSICFFFCCLIAQIMCYFVFDDIIVVLIRPAPVVYIIIRIVIAVFLYIISKVIYDRKVSKIQIDMMFIFYSAFILVLLFFKGNAYTTGDLHINLNPLNIISDLKTSNNAILLLIGNIILYIPFGVYFSYKLTNPQKLWFILLFAIPIISEAIQLSAGVGVFDINDIILNFIGIVLGLILYRKKYSITFSSIIEKNHK